MRLNQFPRAIQAKIRAQIGSQGGPRSKGGTKYKAIRTMYNGVMYDSGREARFAQLLDFQRKLTDPHLKVVTVEHQVEFELQPAPGRIVYRLDFRVTYADGTVRHFEVKGYWTKHARDKMKMMRHKHPDITIEIVK